MNKIENILKKLNLRPTKQRTAIIEVLTSKGNIHVTASSLGEMLDKNKFKVSTATIYNNLNELSQKGFLKKFIVEKDKMWFDTNLSSHYHFYDEEEDTLYDVEKNEIEFLAFPKIPKGKTLKSLDIIINVKKVN
ncbi:transcriptional repressor [Alphaproteobacteria bacterium]|nr:transcriptional repressor [Alphaproteobacteria bacterium]